MSRELSMVLASAIATPISPVLAQASDTAPREPGPWRMQSALGLPDWLDLSGRVRMRYEALDGQFRANPTLADRDHYFVMRSSLRADVHVDPLAATLEILDSRQYGAGDDSFISRAVVNPIDFLQANIAVDLGALGSGRHLVRAGRATMDLGSRRLVARNRFRNTINSFDGATWEFRSEAGTATNVFWTLPVIRLPAATQDLLDNEPELDEQDIDNQFYGGFFTTPMADGVSLDAYTYVLDENAFDTLRREIVTPGLRVHRAPLPGTVDLEAEAAYQFGESSLQTSGTALDHSAWFAHASIGYTFDSAWRPRLGLAYDYASGDRDPTDGGNQRFDTLFGARRFEFGPTGIHGALVRSNISSPELRLTVRPATVTNVMLALRGVWLAESRDFWIPALVRDPTGAAGRHVGEQVEIRFRFDLEPDSLVLELGGAYLFAGRFQKDAPNGRGQDTAYGYLQLNWTF